MNNTETIKIQSGLEIDITSPDEDDEIRMDIGTSADGVTIYLTKEQAQQLIDTLTAFIS